MNIFFNEHKVIKIPNMAKGQLVYIREKDRIKLCYFKKWEIDDEQLYCIVTTFFGSVKRINLEDIFLTHKTAVRALQKESA